MDEKEMQDEIEIVDLDEGGSGKREKREKRGSNEKRLVKGVRCGILVGLVMEVIVMVVVMYPVALEGVRGIWLTEKQGEDERSDTDKHQFVFVTTVDQRHVYVYVQQSVVKPAEMIVLRPEDGQQVQRKKPLNGYLVHQTKIGLTIVSGEDGKWMG